MTANISYFAGAGWQFFSNSGIPLTGGLVYTYAAGTTTPQTTYTTSASNVANTNPIVLDAYGRPPQEIWLTPGVTYKFVLKDSSDVLIGTYDNIPGVNDQAAFEVDISNNSDPAKGDALVGFRQSNSVGNLAGAVGKTVHQKFQEFVSVRDFGAVGDGTTDDTAAIVAAIAASNYVFFPASSGPYIVSSTIQIQQAIQIDADLGVQIKAKSTFTGINVTKDAAPFVLKAIFAIFTGSTINTLSGNRIGESSLPVRVSNIEFLGNSNAVDYCLYIERCPGVRVFGVHTYSGLHGIYFGPYCWGLQCMNFRIFQAANIGLYLGEAANGAMVNNFEIWGGDGVDTSVCLQSNGNNNGVEIVGGYIEKGATGIYINGNCGAHDIRGIDFEVFSQHSIRVNATDFTSFGPITIEGCYLQSTDAMIYNNYGYIIARGNTFRAGGNWTGQNYLSTTTAGLFIAENNRYQDLAGTPIAPGLTGTTSITSTQTNSDIWSMTNRRRTEPSGAYASNYGVYNYTSGEEPEILSGSFEFQNSRQGNPGAVYASRWKMVANQTWLNGTTPEVQYSAGVYLASLGGANSFTPIANNTHKLGDATYRWSEVFATNGTINTSDANEKQQIRSLNDQEKAVAIKIKGLIKTYKFNDSVAKKGDKARIHVGAVAQEVEAAFVSEGLDPQAYGIFCLDTWYEYNGEVVLVDENKMTTVGHYEYNGEKVDSLPADEKGNVLPGGRLVENKYPAIEKTLRGLRYEQLLAFVIAAM
jgi:hypothetical protein